MGKDHRHGKYNRRKDYYHGSKKVDTSCRCHGGCDYCLANRKHRDVKRVWPKDIEEEEK